MARFVLAGRLHKTLTEISDMSISEFNYWFAYLELEREAIRSARQSAKNKR